MAISDIPGHLALPAGGTGPGVLLLHGWWGLKPAFVAYAERLAQAGFVVFAPDLNGGAVVDTIPEAEALMEQRDWQALGGLCLAAGAALREHPAVRGAGLGVVGFSMGAAWSTWLAANLPEVRAVSLCYGGRMVDFTQTSAAFLCNFAEQDDWEPLDGVHELHAAMQAAGREATLHLYPGAGHWFMEDDRPEYDPAAAALAWDRTLAFFQQHLNSPA
ncbi:dienelactone hydrolase family protein [Chloroflexia bacterium SDU3-3]|nr:dienelactone hydrolase family protein [Chloroflexia bacterium SDU3-3]